MTEAVAVWDNKERFIIQFSEIGEEYRGRWEEVVVPIAQPVADEMIPPRLLKEVRDKAKEHLAVTNAMISYIGKEKIKLEKTTFSGYNKFIEFCKIKRRELLGGFSFDQIIAVFQGMDWSSTPFSYVKTSPLILMNGKMFPLVEMERRV